MSEITTGCKKRQDLEVKRKEGRVLHNKFLLSKKCNSSKELSSKIISLLVNKIYFSREGKSIT